MIKATYQGDAGSIELPGIGLVRRGETFQVSEEEFARLVRDPTIKLEAESGSKREAARIEKEVENG